MNLDQCQNCPGAAGNQAPSGVKDGARLSHVSFLGNVRRGIHAHAKNLDRLTANEARDFVQRYEAALTIAYPAEADGTVLFPFRRLFFALTR